MKKTVFCSLVICVVTLANAKLSEETVNAMTWGAKTKVTFRVVDSSGVPVTNALMRFAWSYDYTNKNKEFDTKTDENGLIVIEAKSRGTFTWFAEKTGHYNSKGEYSFDVRGEDRVKDGRWEPWNPTVNVVLKEKRKPTPMFLKSTPPQMQLPRGEKVGFDFDEADLVAPYGKGKRTDILFQFDSKTPEGSRFATTNQIRILAVAEREGLLSFPKDMQSRLKSRYLSPTNGFASVIEYKLKRDQENPSIIYENTLPKNQDSRNTEYLVFRIRVKIDDKGNIIHSRYGKIYGFGYGDHDVKSEVKTGIVNLSYYLNPNDNDPNLEFDGTTNLSDPNWRSPLGDL